MSLLLLFRRGFSLFEQENIGGTFRLTSSSSIESSHRDPSKFGFAFRRKSTSGARERVLFSTE